MCTIFYLRSIPYFIRSFAYFHRQNALCIINKFQANLCITFRDSQARPFMLHYTHDIKYNSFGEIRRYSMEILCTTTYDCKKEKTNGKFTNLRILTGRHRCT